MGGAGVGAGRHGGDVAGFEQEETCRSGTGAGGPDPHDYGNGGAEDLFDDVARGVHEAAGSAEANQQGVGMFSLALARLRMRRRAR